MTPRLLIPNGRWKVDVEPDSERSTIRLSGRAFSDTWNMNQRLQTVLLTPEQAHELVSALNLALLELELQRTADLARVAGGAA
jgi:hypothetical protein